MNTREIEVDISALKVKFLEVQDLDYSVGTILEELQDSKEKLVRELKVRKELIDDIKAHLGFPF